jgi:Family of unknown function (DUF5670)
LHSGTSRQIRIQITIDRQVSEVEASVPPDPAGQDDGLLQLGKISLDGSAVRANAANHRAHVCCGIGVRPGLQPETSAAFWPDGCSISDACGISKEGGSMLWTIFVILFIMWLLGMVTSYTLGGFIHILLVLALVAVVIQLISGRRAL